MEKSLEKIDFSYISIPMREIWAHRGIIFKRLASILLTLLSIAYLSLFTLILAERGQARIPAKPLDAAFEAIRRLGVFVFDHPRSYVWHKELVSAFGLVYQTLSNSAGLLFFSMLIAAGVGISLGIVAAVSKHKIGASAVVVLSVLGISTPSFLFGMLLWVVNIYLYRWTGVPILPSVGFGWDGHMIMPALVLAMRPLAQVAQVTYVSLSEVMKQDYIRVAYSKGMSWRLVRNRHAMRNILVPVLTTLGTSLRYSLASLPVVEFFFVWPGVGLTLLQAIDKANTMLATDLIVSLGLFFLGVNFALELIFPILDPRTGENGQKEERDDRLSLWAWVQDAWFTLKMWVSDLARIFQPRQSRETFRSRLSKHSKDDLELAEQQERRWKWRSALRNPALLLGVLLVIGAVATVAFGEHWTTANPYQIHGVTMIDGVIKTPPFAPSSFFPWGSDHIGRDLQAFVLAGAKRTLMLALVCMLARVLMGTLLGAIAGWWRGGWFDRLVTSAVGVWAAFPVTIFALIIIQALGIQQGMWVFVVALSVAGWGEVAQFVRGQIVAIKPLPYIESARAVGSRPDQILFRQVLPNLTGALLVMAALEMGGILMLLAELGYLNIFVGGGNRAEIAVGAVTSFSDVPEWGALLANVRNWWRTYPWMALYPGGAFFLSILAFNLVGEGLRRFMDDNHINLNRIFSRYTLSGLAVVGLVIWWGVQSSTPIAVYSSDAQRFDPTPVMADIQELTSPTFGGRETGTTGSELAADYIASRMQEVGLLPAGSNNTYIQGLIGTRYHLTQTPTLEILDQSGKVSESLTYRKDFVEYASGLMTFGEAQGKITGVAMGPQLDEIDRTLLPLRNFVLGGKVLIVRQQDAVRSRALSGIPMLVVTDDPLLLEQKFLYSGTVSFGNHGGAPAMYITPELADRLLATAGSSLRDLDRLSATLKPGQAALTEEGVQVHLKTEVTWDPRLREEYYNVIGYLPGQGSGTGLDSHVIIVSAYYDGLGTGPDGTQYPGANDNASSVAAMLEMARMLKQSPYQPEKTIVFVAWAGGERGLPLILFNVMNAKSGFGLLDVEAILDMSGVGAGSGSSILLDQGSSYRLVTLYRQAASRFGVPTTGRGRGPHYMINGGGHFSDNEALSLFISWDGSDQNAHTPQDTPALIDPQKLKKVSQSTYLTLLVLAREINY